MTFGLSLFQKLIFRETTITQLGVYLKFIQDSIL